MFVSSLLGHTASHAFSILDTLSCHTDIQHPQETVIVLPSSSTVMYQSLDKGVNAMIKRR